MDFWYVIISITALALILATNAALVFQIVFIQGQMKLMTEVITERMVASEKPQGWLEEKQEPFLGPGLEMTRFHIPPIMRSRD